MIDTHCHLNFEDAFPDVLATLNRAAQNGVERVIVVGCDTKTSERAIQLADAHEPVYACIGWHPTYAANYTKDELRKIGRLATHPKCVAIGEVGLDNHWDYSSPDQQRICTSDHLSLASDLNKPVVFHCREAYLELLQWLETLTQRPRSMVMHCFSGTFDDARRASRLGCYFGVDGPLTYKSADSLRQVVSTLPRERILLETDAPYLAPHPFRGKPNEPALLRFVNEQLAEIWGVSTADADEFTTANARSVFWVE